jgi:hypothetical protein
MTITIKGRNLYANDKMIGEITGYRETSSRFGPVGPGYGFRLTGLPEIAPCYAYFQDAVKAAKVKAAAMFIAL